ncbi:unnamed protein product [Caenorhabditis sp. 36 PRJEB53466]|nr:unnamed protein product [Caenorhabditis sp. 36 PRJEB53466]
MANRLVSEEALELAQLHRGVRDLVRDKKDDMDQPTREAVFEILLDGIREIEEVMVLPTIRGHLDPNLRNPAVDEDRRQTMMKRMHWIK